MARGTHEQLAGYIWGPVNAEDLVVAPDGDWVLTSGMIGPTAPLGRLYAVSIEDGACSEIFPYRATFELDAERFGAQPQLDPSAFEPHGIDVKLLADGRVELYVVNHGGRESVEVFEVGLHGQRPILRWLGGVALPGSTVGNDVAAVNDGFVVSTTGDLHGAGQVSFDQVIAGADTGGVLEWSRPRGWSLLPGTQINTANGVAVSSDGDHVFIGGWNSRCIRKVRRDDSTDPDTRTVDLSIMVDNLTWLKSGRLLAAGTYDTTMQEFMAGHFSPNPRLGLPSRVISVDPETLTAEELIDYGPETFGAATTGLQVGQEIWVGSARDHGLVRFRFPMTGRG